MVKVVLMVLVLVFAALLLYGWARGRLRTGSRR